jgi:hypothetical protein
MLRKTCILIAAAVLVTLTVSSKVQAWGAYRHAGFTRYSPYTGLHHYGYTEAYRGGYGGYGGYHYGGYGAYGGYHYGGYGAYGGYHYGTYPGYGGYRYGYYRAY